MQDIQADDGYKEEEVAKLKDNDRLLQGRLRPGKLQGSQGGDVEVVVKLGSCP